MPHSQQPQTWRDNWFVHNVLVEMPIIGGCFRTANTTHALHHAGKSSFMLTGGTVLMFLNVMQIEASENPGIKLAKMLAGMAIGMTGGKVIFNITSAIGGLVVNFFKRPDGWEVLDTQQGEGNQPSLNI